jgi:hypothetical protein
VRPLPFIHRPFRPSRPGSTSSDRRCWPRAARRPSCRRQPSPHSPLYRRFYWVIKRWHTCGEQQLADLQFTACQLLYLYYPLLLILCIPISFPTSTILQSQPIDLRGTM